MGVECIRAVVKGASLYLKICLHVRQKQLARETVKESLRAAGFADSRISEVWRVSTSTDEIFAQFSSGVLGFKSTVNAARVKELGYDSGQLDLEEDENAGGGKVKPSVKNRLGKAADVLLRILLKAKKRSYTFKKYDLVLKVSAGADNDGGAE